MRHPPRSSSSAWDPAPLGSHPAARWAHRGRARRASGWGCRRERIGRGSARAPAGVSCIEPVSAERLREMYADADVLVVALDLDAHVPRAMGAGRQRGDEPRPGDDRQRRRRRGRGRAGARRAQRPGRAGRRQRRARGRDGSTGCRTPSCAPAWAPPERGMWAPTPTRRGPPASPRRWQPSGSPGRVASFGSAPRTMRGSAMSKIRLHNTRSRPAGHRAWR